MPIPNPVFLLVPYRFSTGSNSGSIFSQLPIDGTGDFTYIRPGSASFIGSNGNIQFATSHSARILNYYSGSGTCPAFLIEPSAQNQMIQSQDLSLAFPSQANTTPSANVSISPDGTQNADRLTFVTTGGFRLRNFSIVSGTSYTATLFYKNVDFTTGNIFSFQVSDGVVAAMRVNINPVTNTITQATGPFTNVSSSIENYGNGWYRVRISGTASNTGGGWYELVTNAAKSIDLWGFQFETGLVATSYIPTTTATVTRNADITTDTSYTLPLPNGTIYTEHFASRISSYYAHSVGPVPITTGSNRIAVTYTPSKIAVYKNGSFLMSQSMGTYEVGGSIINLGHSSGSYQLNDNLLAFAVYNSELTPADAISLTSGSL